MSTAKASPGQEDAGAGRSVPPRVGALRLAIGAVGVPAGLYGAWLLVSREGSAHGLIAAAEWLAAGVLLHDFVLAPLVLGLLWLGRRALPEHAHVAAVAGLVVLGSITLFAVPVLGRFGARTDNPTLLDRSYSAGWLTFAGLVLLAVVVGWLVERSRARAGRRGSDGRGDGGVSGSTAGGTAER